MNARGSCGLKKRALEDYWSSEAFTGRLVCRDMMMIPFFEMFYEAIYLDKKLEA